jgi:hypothetical protein
MLSTPFARLHRVAVAAAILSVGAAAHAATFSAPTSAILTLSSDITSLLTGATFSSTGTAVYNSGTGTLTEAFTSVTLSSSAATDFLGTTDSASGFSLTYNGTVLSITNISYSEASKALSGTLAVGGVSKYTGSLLTSSTASVSEAFNASLGTGYLSTGNLYLTSAAATAMLSAFGMSTSALYVGIVTGVNFGTFAADVTGAAAAAVPEPGTYALMGLGLVGIASVVRRRRAD